MSNFRNASLTIILLFLLAACDFFSPQPSPSPAPSATSAPTQAATNTTVPTPTLTLTPTPTQTLSPTATPTAVTLTVPRNYRVLFLNDKHLWSINLDGTNMQRITPDDWPIEGFGFSPIPVSPDQRYVAVTSSGMGTWLVRLDGNDTRQISRDYVYPSWSPDSRTVTYADAGSIFVRSLNDWQRPRRIASGNYGSCSFPTWSSDGQWIASREIKGIDAQPRAIVSINLLHPDGSGVQQLDKFEIGGRGCAYFELQWSSNGQYLLVWGAQTARLWALASTGNRLTEMQAVNMLMSPFAPYLWVEDRLAVEEKYVTFAEPMKERVEKINRCEWGTLAFDVKRLACFPSGYANNTYDPNTIQVIDIESGQTTKVKLSVQNRLGLHWIPNSDFLILETATPSEVPDLWLVSIKDSEPLLITHGVFAAVLSAK